MAAGLVLAVCVIVVFAGASFFFSLAETSLFSLSKWQTRSLSEREPVSGGIVGRLLAQPEDLLATMVLGNTFANAAILATALWMALHDKWPWLWTVVGLVLLILIGCEVLPKTMGVRRPEQWALRVARPLAVLQSVAKPLRHLAHGLNQVIFKLAVSRDLKPQTGLTDSDYKELLEMAYQQGALAQSEKEIILQIISLDHRTVKEVMRSRSQMTAISDDLSIEEMIAAAKKYRHRRLPIHDESADTIVGVLNTRALLLDPQIDLVDAIEFPSFVPETMNLLQLLKSLQRQQRGLAIVLDEYGGTAGIVTLQDILEQMVGRSRDDLAVPGLVMEKLETGRWRVGGTLRLDDFRREFPGLGEVAEVETMGGLLVHLLGVVPVRGESALFRGLKLTAHVADERRVKELLVEVIR
jgi:CBS domain containing-hemolysin-like protein